VALVLPVQNLREISMHLSWKCLGFSHGVAVFGVILEWHCFVNITDTKTH